MSNFLQKFVLTNFEKSTLNHIALPWIFFNLFILIFVHVVLIVHSILMTSLLFKDFLHSILDQIPPLMTNFWITFC